MLVVVLVGVECGGAGEEGEAVVCCPAGEETHSTMEGKET